MAYFSLYIREYIPMRWGDINYAQALIRTSVYVQYICNNEILSLLRLYNFKLNYLNNLMSN